MIGLLLVTALLVFLFIKMYSDTQTSTSSEINTYTDSIDKAGDIKNMLESKNTETYEYIIFKNALSRKVG